MLVGGWGAAIVGTRVLICLPTSITVLVLCAIDLHELFSLLDFVVC